MKLDDPQNYFIELQDTKYLLYPTASATKTCTFLGASSSKDTPKIYTISDSGGLIYVGITTGRMSARLRSGLTAMGNRGYHGYKWKNVTRRLALAIWTYPYQSVKQSPQVFLETIEAEVAFLCRQAGQWPTFQHEIHFHPSEDTHRGAAQMIFDNVGHIRSLLGSRPVSDVVTPSR